MSKTYNLSDTQIHKIANLCLQEQGSIEGAKAEASLMANLLETHPEYRNKYGSDIYAFVRNSGWFSKAAYWMDNGNASAAYDRAVKSVLVDGKRTLPPFVDEHDCFSDITEAMNDAKRIDVRDRTRYVPDHTIIRNRYGSGYRFWCFPTLTSDPFGYSKQNDMIRKLYKPTVEDLLQKAESYIGVSEPKGDDYFIAYYNSLAGTHFDYSVAWCAIFVTDIARMVGFTSEVIPTFADCDEGKMWFFNRKRYMRSKAHGGSYIPVPGDVVFYSSRYTQEDSTHVGYVVSCDGKTLKAIEGNHNDMVAYRTIDLSDAYIIGYGRPQYTTEKGDWDGVDIRTFIKNCYVDILFREPTDMEVTAWAKDVSDKSLSPEEVQEHFRNSAEGRREWVKMLYATVLHREAKPDEVKAWVSAMEHGESREEVMADIRNSQEANQ